ncbi:MAG: O-antigen ligase family protein [Salinivirgaceae bacterium]|nr:O-antigen ligase family protein [Salinivirgaceae bacterium]
MGNKILQRAYYIIIPTLLIGISLGYTNFNIAFAALLPLLFMTNRHTLGVFLTMYGGPLGGVIRAMYPSLPVYGLLLRLIGFILIWELVVDLFSNNLRFFGLMALLLAVFGIFYMIGPQDEWAIDKYSAMCINGFIMIICYYAYCRSNVIDAECLYRLLIIAAICMFAYVVATLSIIPGQIYDYNWFREQSLSLRREYEEYDVNVVVGYQHVGMLLAYAVTIVLSQIKINKQTIILYVICGLHASLMSGCRQAVLAIVIVIALRMVVFTKKNLQQRMSMTRILGTFIGISLSYYAINFFFENVQSDVISYTLEEGDSGRQSLFLYAWNIFLNYPIMGAGIGGFHAITGEVWPHNFFLEALCETGLVGTTIIVTIAIATLVRKRVGLFFLTESNMFYFLVVITLFIRVMVSSDFTESIELYSAILTIPIAGRIISQTEENDNESQYV